MGVKGVCWDKVGDAVGTCGPNVPLLRCEVCVPHLTFLGTDILVANT
jgi:hypothetical protein